MADAACTNDSAPLIGSVTISPSDVTPASVQYETTTQDISSYIGNEEDLLEDTGVAFDGDNDGWLDSVGCLGSEVGVSDTLTSIGCAMGDSGVIA
jgi:hypothetical protein